MCLYIFSATFKCQNENQVAKHGRFVIPPADTKAGKGDRHGDKVDDDACGNVCEYSGKLQKGKYYPFIKKNFDCKNIMRRMGKISNQESIEPPKYPPKLLHGAFTQFGESKIKNIWYIREVMDVRQKVHQINYSSKDVENLQRLDRAGNNTSSYQDFPQVRKWLRKYAKSIVKGKRGFVVGTQRPWIEAIMLNHKAAFMTTVEYQKFKLEHPQLEAKQPHEIAQEYLKFGKVQFDFGMSFSSIEHSGLGRYGDPLNPYADLETMAQNWCLTKPGGYFILGVQHSEDGHSWIQWNAHRLYGNSRLKYLTANWDVVDRLVSKYDKDIPHVTLLLRKPTDISSDDQ